MYWDNSKEKPNYLRYKINTVTGLNSSALDGNRNYKIALDGYRIKFECARW